MAKIKLRIGDNEIEIDSRDFYVDNNTTGQDNSVHGAASKFVSEGLADGTMVPGTRFTYTYEPGDDIGGGDPRLGRCGGRFPGAANSTPSPGGSILRTRLGNRRRPLRPPGCRC